MGAAFLLLETMNVVRFALLFGTTWFVNALVFAGHPSRPCCWPWNSSGASASDGPVCCFRCCSSRSGSRCSCPSPALCRSAVRVAVRWPRPASAFAPIFVANVVFAGRFRDTRDPTAAFGANLLGAMLGGTLEYLSLVTGYRGLLFAVAALYALAWLFGRRFVGRDAGGARALTRSDVPSVGVG